MLTTLLSWPNKTIYSQLSQHEKCIFEIELFVKVCKELKLFFKNQTINSFSLMKLNIEMEDEMLELNLAKNIINDILITEEYSLSGIAYYTNTSEEVLLEVILEKNKNPSAYLFRKILELHRTVRHALYEEVITKIIKEHEKNKLS